MSGCPRCLFCLTVAVDELEVFQIIEFKSSQQSQENSQRHEGEADDETIKFVQQQFAVIYDVNL